MPNEGRSWAGETVRRVLAIASDRHGFQVWIEKDQPTVERVRAELDSPNRLINDARVAAAEWLERQDRDAQATVKQRELAIAERSAVASERAAHAAERSALAANIAIGVSLVALGLSVLSYMAGR